MDFRTSLVTVLFSIFVTSHCAIAKPVCTGNHCDFVGDEKPWPNSGSSDKSELHLGRFVVRVPQGWLAVAAAPDMGLAVKYREMVIGANLVLSESSDIDPEELEKSGYLLSDIPQLVFSPSADMPADAHKQRVWKSAMRIKQSFYKGASNASIYRDKGRVAYSVDVKFGDISNITMLTSSEVPDAYVVLFFQGASTVALTEIIGNFELTEDE